MKKTYSVLIFLALLLALCACGGTASPAPTEAAAPAATAAPIETEAPAATEAPSETEAPAPVDEPVPEEVAPYPVCVAMGETYSADLNGDGTAEAVCVSLAADADGYDRVCLTIDGRDESAALYDNYCIDCPAPDFWFITDIYSVDNLLEIAVQDYGPSDDYHTLFLRYELGAVYPFGDVPGLIYSAGTGEGALRFLEDGFIRTAMRLSVLQTWYAEADYEIAPRGELDVVPQERYEAVTPTAVTLLTDLLAYDGPEGDSFPVETGIEMTITATDNREWFVAVSESEERELWFRLNPESGYETETPTGYVWSWEALDGLCMAD